MAFAAHVGPVMISMRRAFDEFPVIRDERLPLALLHDRVSPASIQSIGPSTSCGCTQSSSDSAFPQTARRSALWPMT